METESILRDMEVERDEFLTDTSPSVAAMDAEVEEARAQQERDDAKAAREAYRGTPVEQHGPSQESYDYVTAYKDGTDFSQGNLPNKYLKPGTKNVQGWDLGEPDGATRARYVLPESNPKGERFEKAGIAELRNSSAGADGTEPVTDLPALSKLAYAAQAQGVEEFEDWRKTLGDVGHDPKVLRRAWNAAENTSFARHITEHLDNMADDYVEGVELEAERIADEVPDIDPATLSTNTDWLDAARKFYEWEEGEPFEGSDEELAQFGMQAMSEFNWNTVDMGRMAVGIANAEDPELAKAFLYLLDTYDHVDPSWAAAGRATWNILTDPTTYVGVGVGTLAFMGARKLAAKVALKKAIQGMVAVGAAGAAEGGLLSAAQETATQTAEQAAGVREGYDVGQIATEGAVGAVAGGTVGAALGGAGAVLVDPAKKAGKALIDRTRQNLANSRPKPYGSPAAQRGAIGDLSQPPKANQSPRERSAKVLAQERLQPANPRPGQTDTEAAARIDVDIDDYTQRTGVGLLDDANPVKWNGKDIPEWTPDDWNEFGKANGVENLGPLTEPVAMGEGGPLIPGGTEGKFTYVDMLWLKSQGYNPNDWPMETRIALQKKLSRSTTPEPGDHLEVFNRMVFGMLSPNQPLTPNEFEYARLRAPSWDAVKEWASMATWPEGTVPSPEDKLKLNKQIARKFQTQKAAEGGMGLTGTADKTAIADLARQFLKDPDFFHKKADESWHLYVQRIMSQSRGMAAKVATFSTVWQDPLHATISAVDRHMGRMFKDTLLADPKVRADFEAAVVNKWNASMGKAGNEARAAAETLDDVMAQPGGSTVFNEYFMSYITATKGAKMRTPKGEFGKGVPEEFKSIDWVVEPEKLQLMGDVYKRALAANDEAAMQQGLHLFSSQWMLWDGLRGRLEPHEIMFPGLYKLPKPSRSQLERAFQHHRATGFTGHARAEDGEGLKPIAETPAWKKSGGMDWQQGGYFSVMPMLGAGELALEGADDGQDE